MSITPHQQKILEKVPPHRRDAYLRLWGESRGLGDTVAKVLKATGVAKVVKSVLGEKCGCAKRQAALNRLVPYKADGDSPPPQAD